MSSPSAICTVNSTTIPITGTSGINVSGGSTITVALVSNSGVSAWSISATQADDATNITPINNTKVVSSYSATFVMPSVISGRGAAVQFTSIVNQGTPTENITTFGVWVLNTNGNRLFFGGETYESNATVGNAADLNSLTTLAAGSFTAGGDLTGSSSSQNVIAIHSATTSVNVGSATAPTSGQVLTATSGTAATWQAPTGGAPSGTASGDLAGSYPSPTVTVARGLKSATTTVATSSATAPSSGQVLTATSSTTATWQAPAGGAPSGTAGGDLSGTYPNPSIASISGSSPIAITPVSLQWVIAAATPTLKQIDQTAASTAGKPLTIQAQNATGTTSTGGILNLVSGTGTTAAGTIVLKVGSTTALTVNANATLTASSLSTGIVHSDGSGNLTSSTLVNADVSSSAAIAYSKLGTGTQTIGAQEFDTTVDAKGTVKDVQPKHVQTTDATVTTLDSFTIASGTTLIISCAVSAIKSDSSAGAAYLRTAAFRNNAGTVAQIGSTQDGGTFENDSTWDCTIDNSGTTIRIRVTGKAATTIQWTAVSTRVEVIP